LISKSFLLLFLLYFYAYFYACFYALTDIDGIVCLSMENHFQLFILNLS